MFVLCLGQVFLMFHLRTGMTLQVSLHTHVFHTPISVADIPPRRFDRMNGPRRQGWKKNSCLDVPGSSKWLVDGL